MSPELRRAADRYLVVEPSWVTPMPVNGTSVEA